MTHFQVTGGWSPGDQDSTDFVEPENSDSGNPGSVTSGPTMPGKRRAHCTTLLHDGSVMFIGK